MFKMKSLYLLLYFLISLFFMEIIFRTTTTELFIPEGLIIALLFSINFSILFFILCCLFNRKFSYVVAVICLLISGLIFASQQLYYSTFKTFYSVYSAGNSTQILEFQRDFWYLLSKNWLSIVPFFIPSILMLAFGYKIFHFKKLKFRYTCWLVLAFIFIHSLSIGIVIVGDKKQHSAYDLYFNSRNSVISSDRLGLLTTMRIDLQRHIFGWSPSLEVSAPLVLEPPLVVSEPTDDEEKENIDHEVQKEIIEYNTLDINFEQMIDQDENDDLKEIHQYFASVTPTEKNEYTGKFQGYNLILITAESYAPYAVQEETTPTLYKMINEGYRFTNFYTPLWEVSTSDGEYVALTGLLPKSGVWSFKESSNIELPFVMGNQLHKLGYSTRAYHNHTYTYYSRDLSHPNMGYEYKGIGNGLNVQKIWPASDLEMIQQTVPEYIDKEPFHTYYMTVSGHMQYNFDGNNMARKNKPFVDSLPYSQQARAYLATQIELDRALEYLLFELDKAGIAEQTLIAISADHYPYGLDEKTIEELSGQAINNQFDLFKNNFIIYTKGIDPVVIDKPSSSLDIIPTLSNLLGLKYDSRLLMGNDIFSNSEPIVPFLDRSFITDKGCFNALTGEFSPNEGVEFDEEYVNRISLIVNSKFYYSTKILDHNYYDKVLK